VNLEPILNDFYEVFGWDIKTGIPTVHKLNELGLQRIAQDLQH
jgi:aldehyde:ferredoxin oxidoreductase